MGKKKVPVEFEGEMLYSGVGDSIIMVYNLTETQKDLLKILVDLHNKNQLYEPIMYIGYSSRSAFGEFIIPLQRIGEDDLILNDLLPNIKWHDFQILADNGLLSLDLNRKGDKQFYLLQSGIDAVNNDFQEGVMSNNIERDMFVILHKLVSESQEEGAEPELLGPQISELTDLSVNQINDAVTLLVEWGYTNWQQFLGTGPYNFHSITLTPRGRYDYEKMTRETTSDEPEISTPTTPIGSPYGFQEHHWDVVTERKRDSSRLYVVFGHQFESEYYQTETLQENIEAMVQEAVGIYNTDNDSHNIELSFISLSAGYGGHLFNDIARDIIGSDIAIFETSDQNPNVMIEMGVALTWGTRVLPIKLERCERPPSDISGQTWADYRNDGLEFVDPNHMTKLVDLIQKTIRSKVS